jgi:PAS domain S-box-containing protein
MISLINRFGEKEFLTAVVLISIAVNLATSMYLLVRAKYYMRMSLWILLVAPNLLLAFTNSLELYELLFSADLLLTYPVSELSEFVVSLSLLSGVVLTAPIFVSISKTQEQLRANELTYRTMFETSFDAVFLLDNTTYVIIDCNQQAVECFGYSREELIGKKAIELSAEKSSTEYSFQNNINAVHLRYFQRKDGTVFPADISGSIFYRDDKEVRVGFIRDLTEKLKQKEIIQHSDERFRLAMDALNGYLYEIDLATNLEFRSHKFEQIVGYTSEEVLFDLITDNKNIHPNDCETVLRERKEDLSSARTHYEREYRIRKKDGDYIVVMDRGNIIRNAEGAALKLYGSIVDITARRQAEQKVQESETYLQGILESTDDGILAVDNNGRLIKFNNRFAELWNLPDEEMRSGNGSTLITRLQEKVMNPEEFLQSIQILYNSSSSDFDIINLKDGRVFERFTTSLNLNNDIVGRVWSFRDVTEREKNENSVKKYNGLLTSLLENLPFDFWARDINGMGIVQSTAGKKLWGDIVQHNPDDQEIDEGLRNVWKSNNARAFAGEVVRAEKSYALNGSSERREFFEMIAPYYIDHSIGGVLGINIDITESKRAVNKLRDSETLLKQSQAISKIGSYVLDIAVGIWKGSEELDVLFGIRADDDHSVEGWTSVVHPEHRQQMADYFLHEVLEKKHRFDKEYKIQKKNNGAVLWVHGIGELEYDTVGVPVRMIGTIQDITERKVFEAELNVSEEKYRLLVEGSPDAIEIYIDEKVVYVNEAAVRLMRASDAGAMIGKSIFDFVHPSSREIVIRRMEQMTGERAPLPYAEEQFIRLDGTVVDVEVKAIPILYQNNSGVQLIIRDITERKKAVAVISASEMFVKDILNSLTESIAVLNEAGTVVEVNTAWKEFGANNNNKDTAHGVGSNYLEICKKAAVLNNDEFALRALNGITEVINRVKPFFEMEYPCHSPLEQRWFMMRAFPIKGLQKGVVVSHENITDQKRSQELLMARLRISEFAKENSMHDLMQKTLDEAELLTGSSIGFFHFVDAGQENLTLQAWSTNTLSAMCTAEGHGLHYSISKAGVWTDCIKERKPVIHNEYLALPHRKGMPEGHAPVVRELVVPIMRNNRVEALLGIGNKPTLYNESDTKIVELLANLAWDIVLRKQAQNAFMESEQRWRYALEGAGDAVWEWDFVNNKVFRSAQWKEMLGYLEEEVSDTFQETERLIHPDDLALYQETLRKSTDGTTASFAIEYRLRCKNGEYKWVLKRGKTMQWQPDNKPSRIIGTHTDISQHKKIQSDIQELNDHLEEKVQDRTRQLQETNKQLETFSYSISHDLRAPLRAIDTFSRILFEENLGQINENGTKQISLIRENTQRMNRLIDDLLEFSRTNRSEMKQMPFDMTILVRKIISEHTSAEPERKIEIHLDPLPKVIGDPSLFRQVFINLIGNALKFSKQRDITIIHIGGSETETETTIFIKDNGAGFDMRYADKLFGVFQRLHTESEYSGTGVGLAIVQRIIQRHGGTIRAEAEPDKGATFTMSIPKY